MAGQMDAKLGIDLSWWVWTLLAWAVVLLLSAFSVDVGAKVLGVLMLLELGLAAARLRRRVRPGRWAGRHRLRRLVRARQDPRRRPQRSAGIALAFAFASFIGFEATAIYGEESRDPKRTVPAATYLAVTIITLLFAITTFAVVSALGAASAVDETVKRSSVGGVPLADSAAGDLLGRPPVRRRLARRRDELARAEQPVRRDARLPELRGPLLLLDGPRGRAARDAWTASTRPAPRCSARS